MRAESRTESPLRRPRAVRAWVVVVAAIAALALALSPGRACAQRPLVLIVSQPAQGVSAQSFIDLAPHLQPALRESGRYEVVAYRPDLPTVRDALSTGGLTQQDLSSPLAIPIAHRIAQTLGAQYLLIVSADISKGAIDTDTTIDARTSAVQWTTLSSGRVATASTVPGKRLSLLESIHMVVAGIVDRLNATVASQPTLAAAPVVKPLPEAAGTKTAPAPVKQPESPSLYTLLIDRARRNGDIANLIEALRRAINEKPRDVQLRHDLVQAYNDRGWHDAARSEAERAVELAPADAALHRLLGDACIKSGDRARAVAEYQEAVRLNGHDAANLVALGDASWDAGRTVDAMNTYLSAVHADPKSALPHQRLARAYVQSGRYADAVTEVKVAHALVAPGGETAFAADHANLLKLVETTLADVLAQLQFAQRAFRDGSRNREQTFNSYDTLRKQADGLGTLLDGLPDVGFNRPQALYSQSAALVVQTIEKSLDYLQTQNTSDDEAARLMRVEAIKQLGEAGKALASTTARQTGG